MKSEEVIAANFKFSHTGEWGQVFLTCNKCSKVVKKDGALKHYHWAHKTKSNPMEAHKKDINRSQKAAAISVV